MKKIVMLTAAAILGLSGISLSQAENVIDPAAATTEATADATTQAASDTTNTMDVAAGAEATDAAADGATEATEATEDGAEVAAAPAEEEPIPEDTPQVKKLIALYPQLVERISPYAKVCFEGDENCDITLTASAGASADGEPRDGKAVFDAICHTCHAAGIAGAPKVGDAGAWGPRIAKGKDTLYDHAINGFNTMPARGGADIPDEEVHNAVDYMISESS